MDQGGTYIEEIIYTNNNATKKSWVWESGRYQKEAHMILKYFLSQYFFTLDKIY